MADAMPDRFLSTVVGDRIELVTPGLVRPHPRELDITIREQLIDVDDEVPVGDRFALDRRVPASTLLR